ncbi:MAG: S9 family peptidase [Clostridium sp.]|nr:S9 family peptidase [Clostridium sp.]
MRKLKTDDFKNYTYLSQIEYSFDGKYAAFLRHQVDMDENKYLSNIYILELDSLNVRKLTSFDEEKNFKWLNNDEILFAANRDEKDKKKKEDFEEFTQLYKINIHGGEAIKDIRFNKNVSSYEILNSGKILGIASFDPNKKEFQDLTVTQITAEKERLKEEKDYEVLEEIPYWSNGGGFTSKKRSRLGLFDEKGTFVTYLVSEETNVESLKLNKNKNLGVFISSTFIGKESLYNDVSIYNEGEVLKLELPHLSISYADFLNDDSLILSASDMKNLGINENSKFYTYDLTSKKLELITPELDMALHSSVGSDSRYGGGKSREVENENLYFTSTQGISSYINRINKSGEITPLMIEEGSVDCLGVHESSVLYIGMKNSTLQEVYLYKDGESKKITSFNDWVTEEVMLSKPLPLILKQENLLDIDGFVLKPVDYKEGQKYPTLLEIHGGPKTVYGSVYYHELQLFANLGYFVVFCNPRGSDGKGNDFSDIRGKYGDIDYDDLMAFTDLALKTYQDMDENNLFVTGGSYGGFMTNWIIGHTHRFKAAASQRSISNWISMFNTTDIGFYFADDQTDASPWENHDKMWDQSPLKYADQVKTPTLFIHSEEDYRCWLTEGLQMFTALKYHNVDSRLCLFKGENHELSRSGKPKHRLRRLNELINWFEQYQS